MVSNFQVLCIVLPFAIVLGEGNRQKLGKKERVETSLWKKEYESELSDAMLSPRNGNNNTRVAQSAATSDNEAVIERLMETITASEKYLKKVESIDFRLNRLDIEVHEKTNSIIKHLTELKKNIQSQGYTEKLGPALDLLKMDVSEIKDSVEKCTRISSKTNVDNAECPLEATLDNRLSFLENHMKSLLTNVEGISAVISEVKSRGRSRNLNKPDQQTTSVGNALDAVAIISEFRRAIHEQTSRKCDCKTGRVDRAERYPTDCQEIQAQGFNITGIYKIKPEDIDPFYVLCDLNSAGGGWTVIQNRFDGSQDFFKSWSEYKHGFGNLAGEFWLGLDKMYHLTNQKLYELRIELEGRQGQEAFASFSVFTLGPEYEGYRISTLGTYRGNAGDSLSYHAGQKFSTYDVDNDEWKDGSCAKEHEGAWWYKECDKSNLNGKYAVTSEESTVHSLYWISFKGPNAPIFKSKIMIRPLPASRPSDSTEKPKAFLSNVKHPSEDLKQNRMKDTKGRYDARGRPLYRYDDNVHPDGFFPNYA